MFVFAAVIKNPTSVTDVDIYYYYYYNYIYIYSLGTFFFYSSSIFEWISGTDIRNRIYEALFCRSGGKRYDVIRVEETIELNSFFCLSHSSP